MIRLTRPQQAFILHSFRTTPQDIAPAHAWRKRAYAPMYIHAPELDSVRRELRELLPEYEPVFDIVFEAPADRLVDFHCDYESLGPFIVDRPWGAIRDSFFVSVHFNLTDEGGALCTLSWPWLSYVHYRVIVATGIYSVWHSLLNLACRPLFWLFGRRHDSAACVGNAFDNMRLHAVTPGASRISYVVRLVRRGGCVYFSRGSLREGAARSDASRRLHDVLVPYTTSEDPVDAGELRR